VVLLGPGGVSLVEGGKDRTHEGGLVGWLD
jgi:hypothetical protein